MKIYERKYSNNSCLYLSDDKKITISLDKEGHGFSYGTDIKHGDFLFKNEKHATVRKLENHEIISLIIQGKIKL